jgi:hypothetical protein
MRPRGETNVIGPGAPRVPRPRRLRRDPSPPRHRLLLGLRRHPLARAARPRCGDAETSGRPPTCSPPWSQKRWPPRVGDRVRARSPSVAVSAEGRGAPREPARTQETRASPRGSSRCSLTVETSAGYRKLGLAGDVARRGASSRLAGWPDGCDLRVLLGLLVPRSRRDGLPFGHAEVQARATGSGEG